MDAIIPRIGIQSIFFKCTGVGGVSIHALRSSFVTFAGNESTEAVMESIAVAMRHSRRYQQDIYDKRTINEKEKRGVHFASKQVQQALRRPPPAIDVTSPKKYFKSSVDDSDEDSDEPTSSNVVVPGESVAQLASDSTESRPKLLFSKVNEMNATAKMVLSNELVETFPGYYRLKIGSNRLEEKLSCLITGIDMVYSCEHRAYELRTPLDDITQLQILQ